MARAAIALGSNLGERLERLRSAVAAMEQLGTVEAVSSLYDTDPVGGPDQGRFLNAVVVIVTGLAPLDLLDELQRIETAAGRVREVRWGPRTLDLDLITYGEETIHLPTLEVPHPRASERRFVLAPLAEVWPEAPVGEGLTAAQALAELDGQRVLRLAGDWLHETPTLGPAARRWVAAQLALFGLWGVAVVVQGTIPAVAWRPILGGGVFLAGVVLAGWAVAVLGPELTPYPEPRQGAGLVDRGPYRLVRHPIYGGIVLTFAGVAVARGSWLALILTGVVGGFFLAKSRVEERVLAVAIPGYDDYLRRVRNRLLPGDRLLRLP